MEASADWPSLQKRGFLVIKQFLSAEQCAELAETYQTLPAATDSVGFGVRWASKHVASLLPCRTTPPCVAHAMAQGCSAQQGEWARSVALLAVPPVRLSTPQMGLPPSVMQKIHEALPLVEKHSNIKVDAECCHLMNSMQAACMCSVCAAYVHCVCTVGALTVTPS